MHAPFAQARTFLSEHGFGETKVVLHAEDGAVVVVKAKGKARESQRKSQSAGCPPTIVCMYEKCRGAERHHQEFSRLGLRADPRNHGEQI